MNSALVPKNPSDDGVTLKQRSADTHCLKGLWILKVFLNSLFIQSSFNYRGMQNLGFAFSMLPLAKLMRGNRERLTVFLKRHLQLFNTHPYLSAPIIGSVARMEAAAVETGQEGTETVDFKKALMGPYAALGDSFFWGAIKPFASVFSVLLALHKSLLAPWFFLVLYNPAHLWVRIRGFVEGYRRGKNGVDFIRFLNLPLFTTRIRYISLAGLALIAAVLSRCILPSSRGLSLYFLTDGVFLALILLCFWGIKNGISQVKMLYWMFAISCAVSF